jgi:hypothetical protein
VGYLLYCDIQTQHHQIKLEKVPIDSFDTKLGKVYLNLYLDSNAIAFEIMKSNVLDTKGHQIEIIPFNDVKDWVKETDYPIEDFKGWIVRILKTNNLNESLSLICELSPDSDDLLSDVTTGEHLDSVWIGNKSEEISIGTEDGEMLRYRAEREDWMPERLKDELGYQSNSDPSFTSILKYGLKTNLPALKSGEKIYFHYLVASNQRKKSKEYPDEDDISTNFAVDFPKWTLMKRLNIKE